MKTRHLPNGMWLTVLAAVLAIAGCGTPLQSTLLQAAPASEQLGALPEWARSGVPCRVYYMKDELVRTVPAFVDSLEKAQSVGYADVLARLYFVPKEASKGKGAEPRVIFQCFASGGRKPASAGTYWAGSVSWATGLVPGLTEEALRSARAKSIEASMSKGRLAEGECWGRMETGLIGPRLCKILELYVTPPEGAAYPDSVTVLSHFDAEKKGWVSDLPSQGPLVLQLPGGLFRLAKLSTNEAGVLTALEVDRWAPTFDDVVYMRCNFLTDMLGRAQAIKFLNDFLIEWKTKGMRDRMSGASVQDLESLVVQMEKASLTYDMEANKAKDGAQALIAQGADASATLEIARLLEQRVDILASILETTKQVLAAKRKAAAAQQ